MDYDKTIVSLSVIASAAVTLLAYLGTGLFDWVLRGSVVRLCVATLIAAAVFVVLALLMMFALDYALTSGFTKELNAIARDYDHMGDADEFYRKLSSMSHRPRLSNEKTAYALNLSTALSALGKPDEALEALEGLTVTSSETREIVERQRSEIAKQAATCKKDTSYNQQD